MTDNGITRQDIITATTMTVANGGTTGIITVHRTLTSFKPCAETPDQYHRRYPCDQQEGRKVFESADSCHRSSFSIAGRWSCVSSCLDPTRTADQRAVSPLLAAATHIPAVASPTDAPKIKPDRKPVNYVVAGRVHSESSPSVMSPTFALFPGVRVYAFRRIGRIHTDVLMG